MRAIIITALLALIGTQDVRAEPIVPAAVRQTFTRTKLGGAWVQGLADRGTARPVTADDPVRVASISKLVVALGVMRLLERGALDLDRDVSDYLGYKLRNPDFPDARISLRLLLSHSSSVQDGIDYVAPFDQTTQAALADPKAWDSAHAPGSYFRYANLNFPIIAAIMERVTGERFDRLMARLVLKPLRLDACYNWVTCSDAAVARGVVLYRATGEVAADDNHGRQPVCPIKPSTDGSCDLRRWQPGLNGASFSPQGGLRISMRDLAKIGQMLLNDGRAQDRRFLTKASIDLMFTPRWTFDGENGVTGETTPGSICRYGLATKTLVTRQDGCHDDLFGDGIERVGHAGDAYGLKSGLWIDRAAGTGVAYFVTAVAVDTPLASGASFAVPDVEVARGLNPPRTGEGDR